ncbi:uroporphyrinogen decarboxylase family protein [Geosporobacter ferrireducens]|uniref:uroporphyrinogen decarboxylase family protein n=1 Tax=Geosporobacter ferrireducens TaxID=1424294 RepID=UPI00139C8E36|nr:uroporphyrinogen decarboxylase family protein [Geosporobacter ferrireducens]MTI53712.1 methyltransferase [Geosporobacter ferrireducens]
MQTNKLFDERLKKVKDTLVFKNDSVTNCYMGQAVPPTYMDITLADYIFKPDEGLKVFIEFVNKINDIAPLDCINFGYPALHNVPLSVIWWSKVKMPGRELGVNDLWQVAEKKIMQDEDYDLILNEGYQALFNKIVPQVLDMSELENFVKYHMENDDLVAQRYTDAGYPVVNAGLVCPPFETLCGARSMSQFFMDCYKMPDKVKEAQDVMLKVLKDGIQNENVPGYIIGKWVGGWRGASALVAPKVWDKLVWPYMHELAMALIEKNITPIFHLDQNWDRDIERLLELPAKKCILNTDGMTDLRNARKKLGEHIAFLGDVPSQILATASPEQVSDYVKRLLDDIGTKGVFIAPGCDGPANSKYENLVALHKTAVEYK